MNLDDDDEEEGFSIGVSRYPCTPSLVALQQMRNRLHLAHLGRRLMKWTALATGRELRRLAAEIDKIYDHFYEDLRDAFILLARGRYFYPNLNKMVTENVSYQATVTVMTSTKTMSGVKCVHFDIGETDSPPYQHLGIEKGGQTIYEAKQSWLALLKRLLTMLELRVNFTLVEAAHKAATKKYNVLGKVIIPRLFASISYILAGLEEQDREEFFRLKRFKQLKIKNNKVSETLHICCCCLGMFQAEEDITTESVCPVCSKAAKAQGRQKEIKLKVVPCKSSIAEGKENKKRLENLMSHIDEVIDLTKQFKLEGIVSPSMEKFIKTCAQAKNKIEDFVNVPTICDLCKKSLDHLSSKVVLAPRTGSSKSVNLPPCRADRPAEEPPCSDSTYNLSPETEDKLGYFEKKFKEIVKVTRLQNKDGTISEEKQIITIKTERKNPRKPNTLNGTNDDGDENFMGNCGSGTYENQNYGGDSGGPNRRNIGTRETKSEHVKRNQQMGDPSLRSCMSAGYGKTGTNRDASTNFDHNMGKTCVSITTSKVTLPSENSSISKTLSMDSHVCCPKKSTSTHTSVPTSKDFKTLSKSASVQTCCINVPIKKPMEDKGTCCLQICDGDALCTDKKESVTRTVSTNALWRDQFTSTTDLVDIPSKMPSKKASPAPSCSNESIPKNQNITKSNSCCTIKLIAKPPKTRTFEKKEDRNDEKEVVLKGSMLDAIKKIFLPNTKHDELKTEPETMQDIKSICKSCLSKLSSFVPSEDASIKFSRASSTCKMCQAQEDKSESSYSQSYGISSKSSCESMSCKSMGVGSFQSATSCQHISSKSSKPTHSDKHICCLSKKSKEINSSSSGDLTCCAMAQTAKSSSSKSSICCKTKKDSGSVCCPTKSSHQSFKSSTKSKETVASPEKRDTSTSTKRSTKFDVRPLKRIRTCGKISASCTCTSDSYITNRRQSRRPLNRSKSFYENDFCYYRW